VCFGCAKTRCCCKGIDRKYFRSLFWCRVGVGRDIAGATNPEEADLQSVRGAMGRITTQGVFENLIHVSLDHKEACREIKLWFSPDEIDADLFPTHDEILKNYKKKAWK
jgi:nucleoside-diphosphate kinase